VFRLIGLHTTAPSAADFALFGPVASRFDRTSLLLFFLSAQNQKDLWRAPSAAKIKIPLSVACGCGFQPRARARSRLVRWGCLWCLHCCC